MHVVFDMCAKFRNHRLIKEQALGNWKSDTNKNNNNNKKAEERW